MKLERIRGFSDCHNEVVLSKITFGKNFKFAVTINDTVIAKIDTFEKAEMYLSGATKGVEVGYSSGHRQSK